MKVKRKHRLDIKLLYLIRDFIIEEDIRIISSATVSMEIIFNSVIKS